MKMLSVYKKKAGCNHDLNYLPISDNSLSIASSKGTKPIGNCNLRLEIYFLATLKQFVF